MIRLLFVFWPLVNDMPFTNCAGGKAIATLFQILKNLNKIQNRVYSLGIEDNVVTAKIDTTSAVVIKGGVKNRLAVEVETRRPRN